jgi:hypothetical protein
MEISLFFSFFFFYYSYVHTRLRSFLPPAPYILIHLTSYSILPSSIKLSIRTARPWLPGHLSVSYRGAYLLGLFKGLSGRASSQRLRDSKAAAVIILIIVSIIKHQDLQGL